jgi:DNA-binding MarR family transcriptional regulator
LHAQWHMSSRVPRVPTVTGPDDLAEELVTASRALVGLAVHSVSAAPVDVTVVQFRLLVLVADEPRSIGDLAGHLGVNQSTASRHCDRLQRRGLLQRSRLDADGRVVVVTLTDTGREVVDAVMDRRRADVRNLLAAIAPDRTGAMLAALRELNRAALAMDEAPWLRAPW